MNRILLSFAWLICLVSSDVFSHREYRVAKFQKTQPVVVDEKRNVISEKLDTRMESRQRSVHGFFIHKKQVDVVVNFDNKDIVLKLQLNQDLLPDNYHVIRPNGSNGNNVTYGVEHCYYRGTVEGLPSSMIAVSTCNGQMDGVIQMEGKLLVVVPNENKKREDEPDHVIFNNEDVLDQKPYSCGVEGEIEKHLSSKRYVPESDHDHTHERESDHKQDKRNVNRFVELLVVNDYKRIQDFTSENAALTDSINIANIVTQLYQGGTFPNANGQIIVSIIGQYIPTTEEFAVGQARPEANPLLDEFSAWRAARLGKSTDALGINDNAQLLSGRDMVSGGNSGVAGLGWVGTVCSTRNSAAINEAIRGRTTASTALIVAHELGHNFNAAHDSSGNSCPSSGFVMAAFSCSNCNTWSTCSIDYINGYLPRASCLLNTPAITYPDSNPCGNYVVDGNEQCDQGPSGSTCCGGRNDPQPCRWKNGATCDNSSPCCSNCQLRPVGTVCRTASGLCDLDDTCTAQGQCNDVKRAEGALCGTDGSCNAGTCVSRATQCSALNNFRLTSGSTTHVGPYTPCNTNLCSLQCSGSGSSVCLNFANFGFPENSQKFVAFGLPCTCTGGAAGRCTGTSTTCNCSNLPPPTATTTAKANPTPTPTPSPACDRSFCNNHGTCLNFVCTCDLGWAGTRCNLIPGCDGVPGSGKIVDACGVCGGNGQSCAGCDGIPNSRRVYDRCGVCGGTNACLGCDGVPNSGKRIDACGVCGGNNSTCRGCDGVINSGKRLDVCGVCGGDGKSCLGCDGVPNSGKVLDACRVCDGDGSTCVGCDGVANSGKIVDLCGVCDGKNLCLCTGSCLGCDGVPNSGKIYDLCGVCDGKNTICAGCDGVPNSGKRIDACGVCGGDNSTCRGCDGVINSGKRLDVCGVCGGNGKSCLGCDGVPNSGKRVDVCGVCGGNGRSCLGCDGVPNSGKVLDQCGVCDGSNACIGCDGVRNSGKIFDFCGICGGDGTTCGGGDDPCTSQGKRPDVCGVCEGNGTSCLGCDGVPNSGRKLDECGVCGGNNTCFGCDGVKNSGKVIDSCGDCGGNNSRCQGCDGIVNSGKRIDACGVCGGNNFTCSGCDGVPNSGLRVDICGKCGGNGSECGGFERIFSPRIVVVVLEEGKTYNISATRLTPGTRVVYTTDGSAPIFGSSTVYTRPFTLDVTQFLAKPTDEPTRKRDVEEISVILQFQAFPEPGVPRLYQSVISRTTLTFKREIDNGLVGDGGVTGAGAGVIAGSVIGGLLFLGLIAGLIAYFIVAKRSKKQEDAGRKKFRAIYDYSAQNQDELELKTGDVLIMREQYGDGWGRAYNERSRKEGMFPMSYVNEIESTRLMMVMRPATIYSRVSRAFGGRGADNNNNNGDQPRQPPPKPSALPPKPSALPPKPSPSPYSPYSQTSANPTFNP